MIRVLIVDDEPVARRGLRALMAGDPDVEVVGDAANGVEAVESIRERDPDLVFLDVQMPDLDGFQVLDAIGTDAMPPVVFVTAHDAYAIRAFETNAVDYLLKPFDRERFERSLARAKGVVARRRDGAVGDRLRALIDHLDGTPGRGERARVVLRDGERTKILSRDAIEWIEAAGDWVAVHTVDATHLTRGPMKDLLARLEPGPFLRTSRSTAVNADRVVELRPRENGQVEIELRGGKVVHSSRRYGPDVRARFEDP